MNKDCGWYLHKEARALHITSSGHLSKLKRLEDLVLLDPKGLLSGVSTSLRSLRLAAPCERPATHVSSRPALVSVFAQVKRLRVG